MTLFYDTVVLEPVNIFNKIETLCRDKKFNDAMAIAQIHFNEIEKLYGTESIFGPGLLALEFTKFGDLFYKLGALDNASLLYNKAVDYHKRTPLGPNSGFVLDNIYKLALIYDELEIYDKAENNYLQGLVISDGQQKINILNKVALLKGKMGNYDQSLYYFYRVIPFTNELINKVLGFSTEGVKLSFLKEAQKQSNGFFSLILRHPVRNQDLLRSGLDLLIFRKGVVLEAQSKYMDVLSLSENPEIVKTFRELSKVREQISSILISTQRAQAMPMPGFPQLPNQQNTQQQLGDLRQKADSLEARLAYLSKTFELEKKVSMANSQAVSALLPKGSILLDLVKVDIYNFKVKKGEATGLPARYLAFLLPSGQPDKVELVDLGEADTVDSKVARLKREISRQRSDISRVEKAAKELYEKLFKPLEEKLGKVKEVFLSPDGMLAQLPFEIMLQPNGRYLIEDYKFHYLSASRDIIRFGQQRTKKKDCFIFSDPNFDVDLQTETKRVNTENNFVIKRSRDFEGLKFSPLPSTREEGRSIAKIMNKSQLFEGNEANVKKLRRVQSPHVLHIASHGFFFKDLDIEAVTGKESKQQMENPLFRSGIALAGANNVTAGKTDVGSTNDGIITAYEILGLNLRGTDLVTLSACETGLGEVKTSEGVFGLRRAFLQAGAKSLVMSMWSVPDIETKELMVEFYKNLSLGKMNKSEALRQAALKELKTVKERYGHTNPLFWGGFIFLGAP